MPALLHTTLYAFCLGVSCIHCAFAAWSAADGRQEWHRMLLGGAQYSVIIAEEGDDWRRAFHFGIFRAVVAGVSAVYFTAHLALRRIRPNTWFIYTLTDFACVIALAALAAGAQFGTRYFGSAQAVLDILAFFVLAIFYLVLLVGMLVALVRGSRREGFKRAILSSADRLKYVRRHGAPDRVTEAMAQAPQIRITEAA